MATIDGCRRPTDGRYGENPNRLQHYFQYQVILKPSPDDVQDVYLESLAALGVDPLQHDIRFVEDNWESPTLGAWGVGWEVWMDGLEITQFTYFQQAGGLEVRRWLLKSPMVWSVWPCICRMWTMSISCSGMTKSNTANSITAMKSSSRLTISLKAIHNC